MIIMVMGLPGSGKSYFASRLAALIGADYINSDRVRSKLFTTTSYSQREKQWVYEEMMDLAAKAVHDGHDIVLDATFYTNDIRNRFIEALRDKDDIVFIEVIAEEELIKERLKRPREDSDANFEVFREIKQEWDPLTFPHLVLRSTNENADSMLDEAVSYLQQNQDTAT